jgi:hypothetical protein
MTERDRMDNIELSDLFEVMDELGRAKLNEALARVQMKRMQERIAELENAQVSKPRPVDGKAA